MCKIDTSTWLHALWLEQYISVTGIKGTSFSIMIQISYFQVKITWLKTVLPLRRTTHLSDYFMIMYINVVTADHRHPQEMYRYHVITAFSSESFEKFQLKCDLSRHSPLVGFVIEVPFEIRSVPSLELRLRCSRSSRRPSQTADASGHFSSALTFHTTLMTSSLSQCSRSTEGQSLNVKTLQEYLISIRVVAEWCPRDLKCDLYLLWLHPHQQRNQQRLRGQTHEGHWWKPLNAVLKHVCHIYGMSAVVTTA